MYVLTFPDYYEQSSEDIWSCVCRCVASVVGDFSSKDEICGIGFDATCSLVVIGENGKGLRYRKSSISVTFVSVTHEVDK